MRFFPSVILVMILALPAPAWASLPYYNQTLGYTIWLSSDWVEASDADVPSVNEFHDGIPVDMSGWGAAYMLGGTTHASLFVAEIHGRVVSKPGISNFNRFVVNGLQKSSRDTERNPEGHVNLRKATFDGKKNILRLELDVADPRGKNMTTLVYIVYTSTGMLKFVGLVEPGDIKGVQAVDAAVSTLYLDYGLRQP